MKDLTRKARVIGVGSVFSATALATLTTFGAVSGSIGAPAEAAASVIPAYDHVVVAIFENHEQSQIIGASNAPYLTGLSKQGANFTQSYAIEHPSEPNYLDAFSGSNQGVTDDSCPHTFGTENIGHQLLAAGKTFVGYSEGLPSVGSTTCSSGSYARKHNPWVNFSNVPAADNQPYSAFPSDFTQLPTYSWVVPNLCNDMHDCSVSTGDNWSKAHLDAYAQWAKTHNSLLIVTFDEDDRGGNNQIATLMIGAHVKVGAYSEHIDHFSVLRTVEDMYGLSPIGAAANRTPITDAWDTSATSTPTATVTPTPTPTPTAAPAPMVSGGVYTIGRLGTNQVIEDPAGSLAGRQQMIVSTNDSAADQRWLATANADGSFTLKNVASGMCLTDKDALLTAGDPVVQAQCVAGAHKQNWELRPSGTGSVLINQLSDLAVIPSGAADGSALTQESSSQAWTFSKVS